MPSSAVVLSRHGATAVLTIDNGPANALSTPVRTELLRLFRALAHDDTVATLVIHGGARRFIAGADIAELRQAPSPPLLPEVIDAIEAIDKPILAAIDGPALGGGLEIALACDRRIASAKASAGLPETRLGLIPGAGGTQRLPRLVGVELAVGLIAGGHILPAGDAFAMGVFDEVAEDPLAAAIAQADRVVAKRRLSRLPVPSNPPLSIVNKAVIFTNGLDTLAAGAAASAVRNARHLSFADGVSRERETFLRLRAGTDAQARIYLFASSKAALKHDGLIASSPRPLTSVAVWGRGQRSGRIRGSFENSGLLLRVLDDVEAAAAADIVVNTDESRSTQRSVSHLLGLVRADAIIATVGTRNVCRPPLESHPGLIVLNFRVGGGSSDLVEVTPTPSTMPDVMSTVALLLKRSRLQAVVSKQAGLIGERLAGAARRAATGLAAQRVTRRDIRSSLSMLGVLRDSGRCGESIVTSATRQIILAMAREGETLLARGIVRSAQEIDLIMVHGYSFPRSLGGPMWASANLDNDYFRPSYQTLKRTDTHGEAAR